MMPFAWPQIRAQWPAIRRNWKMIVWLGFWGTGLHNAFAYVGLQYTTATNGVILNSSVPIMIIVLGWLVYRDTITRVQALGVAISLAGVLAILTRGDPAVLAGLTLNKGDLIVVVGMIFWAAYTVFLRMKPADLPGLALLACCGCVGVVLLLPLFLAEMIFFGGHVEVTPGHARRDALRRHLPVVRRLRILESRGGGSRLECRRDLHAPDAGLREPHGVDLPRRAHPALPHCGDRAHPFGDRAHDARAIGHPEPGPE